MLCGATQDGQVMVERSDRMWSTGEGNGKPLQYSCLENPMNCWHNQASLSFIISQSLFKFMSIESVMPSNHLVLCHPHLLLPSIFTSIIPIRWPKYWSFSFSISPSNEYSGWTGCISLQSKGLSRVFSNTTVQKHQFFGAQLSLYIVQLSH